MNVLDSNLSTVNRKAGMHADLATMVQDFINQVHSSLDGIITMVVITKESMAWQRKIQKCQYC